MVNMTPSEIVKALAMKVGFDLVGIAEAKQLGPEGERLYEWLSRGLNASMDWMARSREKRIDPRKIVEGAKSVVSLARNYYYPVEHPQGTAKISRYAWGDDYHIVIEEKLKHLVASLKAEFPGKKFVHYCDTGPVMDKAWAQRAGVGWIGKHTNSINPLLGSWFFLSEIITDLECEYDTPAMDHCGECRACIDACPTHALDEPYVLDSNKCISFLTIENRDDTIHEDLARNLQNWIFGCDICQEVCPWNLKFQQPTDEAQFAPRQGNLNLNVDGAHLMSQEEFARRFSGSPVKRAKHSGFLRNAKALTINKTNSESGNKADN